jgi:hypothetical protein
MISELGFGIAPPPPPLALASLASGLMKHLHFRAGFVNWD